VIHKLKRTPGIFLVGFMGCGKTTVGRRLSRELGWTFVDLDHDIETQAGCSIAEIFDRSGETAFRQMEHDALLKRSKEIKRGRPLVVSLGGGAFVQTFNAGLIDSSGISIWLDCPLEIIRARLEGNDQRPLARDPQKLKQLFQKRRSAYSKANYCIRVGSNDSELVFQQIMELEIF
jgi:shikimate kinase